MNELEAAIKAHSLRDVPREACGLVLRTAVETFSALECVNVALKPETSFIINPREWLPYHEAGTLAGYYHSHPKDPAVFSPDDISISEHSKYPVHLYSVLKDQFAVYNPSGAIIPLVGRNFVFNVHDCVTLVDDYYEQKLAIQFSDVDRQLSDMTSGINDIFKWIKERDLVIVPSVQTHDIILMNFGRVSKPNHCAIYLSDGNMIHQLARRPSEVVPYGGYWKKVTMFF